MNIVDAPSDDSGAARARERERRRAHRAIRTPSKQSLCLPTRSAVSNELCESLANHLLELTRHLGVEDFQQARQVISLERPKRSLAQGFSLKGPCQSGGYTSCRFLVVKYTLNLSKIIRAKRSLNARLGHSKNTT